MDKNEILSAAQKDKTRGKEFENKEILRANGFSAFVALFFSLIFMMLDLIAKRPANGGYLAIAVSIFMFVYLYEGIKLKRKLFIVTGIIYSIMFVIILILHVTQIFAKV